MGKGYSLSSWLTVAGEPRMTPLGTTSDTFPGVAPLPDAVAGEVEVEVEGWAVAEVP